MKGDEDILKGILNLPDEEYDKFLKENPEMVKEINYHLQRIYEIFSEAFKKDRAKKTKKFRGF